MNTLRSLIAPGALAVVALACAPVSAGTIWDGGGANDNWTTGENWNGIKSFQTPPPNNGAANIHMAGTVRRDPILDVPYSINSLTFDNGAAQFIFFGQQELTIGAGGVTNNDADLQSVLLRTRLAADQTWNAAAGPMQLNIINLNGFDLTFGGAFPTVIYGAIQGAGDLALADAYASTVTMVRANTYSGATTVAGGTLALKKTTSGGVTIPGQLIIGGGVAAPLARVLLEANEQISQAAGTGVTVLFGGLLDVNSRTETLAELMVRGGKVELGQGGKLSASRAVVTGAGSTLTGVYGSSLYVGEVGAGTLDVLAGGKVAGGLTYVGYGSGSSGVVNVDGDNSIGSGGYIGYLGSGVLNITGGGTVIGGGYVAYGAGSTGVVNVDGIGGDGVPSTWEAGFLFLGYQGTANLNVTNGGYVYSGEAAIGFYPGSTGTVSIDGPGSYWYSTDDIEIAIGELSVTNQGRVGSALPLQVDTSGTLRGNSLVQSDYVYNGGRVAPGPAADTLTIQGNYIQQPYGTLEIEIGGASDFDQLLIPSSGYIASLDGTLEVKLIDGFTPLIGQTFTIVSAYDVDGMFSTLELPDMLGRRFDVIYNPQSVVLKVVLDFGAGAAVSSVPEPGALALIAAAPLFLACARRKRPRWVR